MTKISTAVVFTSVIGLLSVMPVTTLSQPLGSSSPEQMDTLGTYTEDLSAFGKRAPHPSRAKKLPALHSDPGISPARLEPAALRRYFHGPAFNVTDGLVDYE